MARENAQAKARRYLTEGRVRVARCIRKGDPRWKADLTPIAAVVTGENGTYRVKGWYDAETWDCPCEARGECAHIIAVKLVAPLH